MARVLLFVVYQERVFYGPGSSLSAWYFRLRHHLHPLPATSPYEARCYLRKTPASAGDQAKMDDERYLHFLFVSGSH